MRKMPFLIDMSKDATEEVESQSERLVWERRMKEMILIEEILLTDERKKNKKRMTNVEHCC